MAFALTNEDQADDNVTMLPMEFTNITGTYLQHLNEDCLLEIFSNDSLTLMDLCSLAETCTRFRQITQRVFPKDYDITHYFQGYEFTSKNWQEIYGELRDVKRILKNFGPHLSTLSIGPRDQDLLNSVAEYCGDVALKELKIDGLDNIGGVQIQMHSIFQRLLKLAVHYCDFKDVVSSDFSCDSLIELEIDRTSGCVAILKQTFPKLKRFTWHWSQIYTHSDNSLNNILFNFIGRHGHLKSIDLDCESVRSGGLLHAINSKCNELEELTLSALMNPKISFDFSTQGGLAKLKILDLGFGYRNYSYDIAPLQSMKSLETLKLSSMIAVPVQMFDVISKLQNLRELHLTFCPSKRIPWKMLSQLTKLYLRGLRWDYEGVNLQNIITQLINLELLLFDTNWEKMYNSWELCEEDFSKIVKIVSRREHVLTLKCRCDYNFEIEKYCDENQRVKLIKLIDDESDDY